MNKYIIILTAIFIGLMDFAIADKNQLSDDAMFQKALKYNETGRNKEAFEIYNELAKKGYAEAENNLGYMYKSGAGVKQNYAKAIDLYLRSAQKNYVYAQVNLAFMYGTGSDTELSYKKAFYWYEKAAEQDFPAAQHNLGIFYENGLSVKKDNEMALMFFDKACKNMYLESCDRYKTLLNENIR